MNRDSREGGASSVPSISKKAAMDGEALIESPQKKALSLATFPKQRSSVGPPI